MKPSVKTIKFDQAKATTKLFHRIVRREKRIKPPRFRGKRNTHEQKSGPSRGTNSSRRIRHEQQDQTSRRGRLSHEEAELLAAGTWPNAPAETILGIVRQILAKRNGERHTMRSAVAQSDQATRAVDEARARLDELMAKQADAKT